MNIQYISDSMGSLTGVFIPINEWNKMREQFEGIENMDADIPEWHKRELDKRIESYENNPKQVLDFNKVMDDIEKTL